MKTRTEVTPEKLRGGFYTPPAMVRVCLRRIRELDPNGEHLRILEPSAGDGAFVRGLSESDWNRRVGCLFAVEPLDIEAEKCRQALAIGRVSGEVATTSAIHWAATTDQHFDAAIGNPPFVRYQFISARDQVAIAELGMRLGIQFRGVGNLWIPVLLGALSRLRKGGVFAFVVPTECLTGCSANALRQWLLDECAEVQFDLFAPGSFPDVLQEVAVLSGRRDSPTRGAGTRVEIVDHGTTVRRRTHRVFDAGVWTRYLLDPVHLEALEVAQALPLARPLNAYVAFEVSIVTGANDFFSVDTRTLREYALDPWAIPLLPRTRYAPGLLLTHDDMTAAETAGAKTWLLDFSSRKPDPLRSMSSAAYLASGEDARLHERYKCRIREPWFRVPGIVRGELLLSKRCHHLPRVIVNDAAAYTTDTIYRGRMLDASRSPRAVAAAFHNSLTLLTAELEGRSFGGGVLELVPSEIARITTLIPRGIERVLNGLDRIARRDGESELIAATDAALVAAGALSAELVPLLADAHAMLATRRLERNRSRVDDDVLPRASVAAA
jgi:adenine-specific DNA-methyltransferase